MEALRRIAKLWLVHDKRVAWAEDSFSWWPGRFEVKVKSERHPKAKVWRLEVRTKFLKDVDCDSETIRKNLSLSAVLASTYAWVYLPPDLSELVARWPSTKEAFESVRRTVWFQSTAYLTEDNAAWLPETFARYAILQPVDAERQAEIAAKLVRGRPDISDPPSATTADQLNNLHDAAAMIHHEGQQASRWHGSSEFAEVAALYGKNDRCFGVAGADELALETPIGSGSAMILLQSAVPHPGMGAGLLATIHLPFTHDERATEYEAMWLNHYESGVWTFVPQFGNWSLQPIGEGLFEARCSFFIPNAFYQPGIATSVALWQLRRARWWKELRYPDLNDLTMAEIFQQRFGGTKPN